MAWPPSNYPLGTTYTNTTTTVDNHPAAHNNANQSVNETVVKVIDHETRTTNIESKSGGIGRLLIGGHSYSGLPADVMGSEAADFFGARDRYKWPLVLADALGVSQANRIVKTTVPFQAAAQPDYVTFLAIIPEDSLVEAISYYPVAPITGANTNYFEVYLQSPGLFGPVTYQKISFQNGWNVGNWVSGGAPQEILSLPMGGFGNTTFLPHDISGNFADVPAFVAGEQLAWVQHQVGTGMNDPGGMVVVRLGSRLRTLGVGGSAVSTANVYGGGWATIFAQRYVSAPPSVEIRVSQLANISDTALHIDTYLGPALSSGTTIYFAGGVTATLSSPTGLLPTTLSVNALASQIPAGSQGWVSIPTATTGTGGLPPNTVSVFNWGINEASPLGTFDLSAYRESMRATIACMLCPYYVFNAGPSIFQYSAGNGAGAAWTSVTQPVAGQYSGSAKRFTGVVGATPPTITISVGSAFEGGTVDLFFLATQGTSNGAVGTITVDNATPPNGVTKIDTSAIANVSTSTFTATLSGTSATVTGGGNIGNPPWSLGELVSGTGITPGTYISAITDSTHFTLSASATAGSGISVTKSTWVPMVKRITGLLAGAHTIKVTLNSIAATDGTAAFYFYGYGWEANNPTATVVAMNTAHLPTQTSVLGNTDANVTSLNTELPKILAGTSAVIGQNTTEPALPSTVVIADIDTALNQSPANFINDGIHPNNRGSVLITKAVVQALKPLGVTNLLSR